MKILKVLYFSDVKSFNKFHNEATSNLIKRIIIPFDTVG